MHTDTATLDLVVGALVSLLVTFLTHVHAPEPLKAALGIGLSLVGGVVDQIATGQVALYPALLSFAETWAVAVLAHENAWTPFKATAALSSRGLQIGAPAILANHVTKSSQDPAALAPPA